MDLKQHAKEQEERVREVLNILHHATLELDEVHENGYCTAFHINYDEQDMFHAAVIFYSVCGNYAIKHGYLNKENCHRKIENFRKNGFIDFSEINSPITPSQTSKKEKKEKIEKFEKKKFKSEFERRRFIKALKNIMTERLGEKNIIIPNICSCGQLQKKLDALIELGNISVLTYGDLECANNCIYYKHPEEFNKGINDVLKSIKQISYNAFNNKYKI